MRELERSSRREAAEPALKSPAPPPPALLALQRSAGNQAVTRMLQRQVSVTTADVDQLLSSNAIKRARSSFTAVRSALKAVQNAPDDTAKFSALQDLSEVCFDWRAAHASSGDPMDRRRLGLVGQLLDEIPTELSAVSRKLSQQIYFSNVIDPGTEHAVKGLQSTTDRVDLESMTKPERTFAEKHGLSAAEVAAIRIFSADDYGYINPTTANNPSWLKANRAKHKLKQEDSVYWEEGPLHTGVALQGLQKLPEHDKPVYRGQSYTVDDWDDFVDEGVYKVRNFASASQILDIPRKFAVSSAQRKDGEDEKAPPREVGVIFEIQQSGGRDIAQLSLAKGEKEVTLLPGSDFAVQSIIPEPLPGLAKNGPLKQWYRVILVPEGTEDESASGEESESEDSAPVTASASAPAQA
jgi:hypothetical protein